MKKLTVLLLSLALLLGLSAVSWAMNPPQDQQLTSPTQINDFVEVGGEVIGGVKTLPTYYVNDGTGADILSEDELEERPWCAKLEVIDGVLTLTLKGFTYNGGTHGISANGDLTIVLEGNNSITSEVIGIFVVGDLTIRGGGSLTVVGGVPNRGIHVVKDLTIESGTVKASGAVAGIYTQSGNIAISGGTVEATTTAIGGGGRGIDANGSVEISGGMVTATGDKDGIAATGNISIKDSTVTAEGSSTGLNATAIDIHQGCTLNINADEAAIRCTTLNIPQGNWYQWTGDDGERIQSGAQEEWNLTEEKVGSNKKLSIAPISFEGNGVHSVTLMDGEKVWQMLSIENGATLRIGGMPVPKIPASEPEGAMFYRWYTQDNKWVYHGMTVNEDIVAHATWRLPLAGTVTITGDPVVGKTLTATANITTAGITTLHYQWIRGEGMSGVAIQGANSETYVPTAEDVGQKLRCAVSSPDAVSGSIIGETGTVVASGGDDGSGSPSGGTPGGNIDGGYVPPVEDDEKLVESPATFDGGVGLAVVVSVLGAAGTAWLAKKREN